MSHYALAVFCDRQNDEAFFDLLTPYSENNEDEFVFVPVSDEEIKKEWVDFKKNNPSWTPANWLKDSYHYDKKTDRFGNYYNPHGYYDYYTIDGRDCGAELKNGVEWKRRFRKSDYDWFRKPSDEDVEDYEKQWETYSKDGDGWYKAEYYQENYKTKEQYVKEMTRPWIPYAFVTPDGVWHAPGRVGWFAMSDDTAETRDKYWQEWTDFINNAPDCYVSIFDCHI